MTACDRKNSGRQQIHGNCRAFVHCSVVQGSQSSLLSLFFPISYTQTWSSWFKLAPSCCTPATALFCLLGQGKKLPPLLARPSSFSIHSQSLLFSISGHRESFGNVSKRKNILSVKGQSEIGIILENITVMIKRLV